MRLPSKLLALTAGWLALIGAGSYTQATSPQRPSSAPPAAMPAQQAFLNRYCLTCHNEKLRAQGTVPVSFERLDVGHVSSADAKLWEEMVHKLRGGVMPPAGAPRPDKVALDGFRLWVEGELDRAAAERPNPGRPSIRRLTQVEYTNAIRDILALEVDPASLLFPADDADQFGFTNNGGVLSVSPLLLDRYLAAARRISRMAVGDPTISSGFASKTYTIHKMMYQDERASEDLPFGSRGGLAIRHYFPLDGEYVLKVRLRRQIYDYIVGFASQQQLDVWIDGERVARFTIGAPKGRPSAYTFFGTLRGDPEWEREVSRGDENLDVRVSAKAGMRVVGVSFVSHLPEPVGLAERRLSGFSLSGADFYLGNAAVESVAITGPHKVAGRGDTPSRRRIFACQPASRAAEEPCATQILSALARRAYRRPVTDAEVEMLLGFYKNGRGAGDFETGIQFALERMFVSPAFLFRVERTPAKVARGTVYPVSDVELATRLALFVWSSVPDEELLAAAEQRTLSDPVVLERQVRRMLSDARSQALVENFASQWLQLSRLAGVIADPDLFPDFDENLRRDMAQETRLFVDSVIREDRSVLDFLAANYTFLNERLAKHYGVANIYGPRFRRVTLSEERGGLLGHASLLTVTSYPTRTSPVLRGKWLLDNVLGMPPKPPPPDVPVLDEENHKSAKPRSMREQMEQHRNNPVCATCHRVIDPLGFSLENFDAIGRWRAVNEGGTSVDTAGTLADGRAVNGPATLRQALVDRPENFVMTLSEKLLTYALGRGIEDYDQPALRAITRAAARDNYRWSSIVLQIVNSVPFRMRKAES